MKLIDFIKAYWPELALTALLILDLFVRILPVAPMIVLLVGLQFIRLDINSNIFLCLQCLPVFTGAALNTMGISGLGGFAYILGAALIIYGFVTGKTKFAKNGLWSIIPVVAVLLYFTISMLLSSGGDFAGQKLGMTIKAMLFTWVSFLVLFSNFKKVNTDLLGLFLILYAAYLLRLSIDANTISGPAGLFDFAFMRVQTIETLGYIPDVYYISYQFPGAYVLQGIGIFLMRYRRSRAIPAFLFALGLVIILYAGARQMIISIFLVLLLWVLLTFKRTGIMIGAALILLLPVIYAASTALSTLFESTVEEGYVEGGGRGLWLLAGVQLFLDSPVFGVGFGRYNLLGNYDTYPHNLFVEILCELGVVGFLFLLAIFGIMLFLGRRYFKRYIYYFAGLFFMSMASGGMFDNIVLFSLVFAAISFIPYKPKTKDESKRLQTR
ncbi:MAG: O-antigen ligase family protein [Bacteroidales bacterium]|nr:O-antigen ligase family protein [Bacteroidales bacterium]